MRRERLHEVNLLEFIAVMMARAKALRINNYNKIGFFTVYLDISKSVRNFVGKFQRYAHGNKILPRQTPR